MNKTKTKELIDIIPDLMHGVKLGPLADYMGVTRAAAYKWQVGDGLPTPDKLPALAAYLNVSFMVGPKGWTYFKTRTPVMENGAKFTEVEGKNGGYDRLGFEHTRQSLLKWKEKARPKPGKKQQ